MSNVYDCAAHNPDAKRLACPECIKELIEACRLLVLADAGGPRQHRIYKEAVATARAAIAKTAGR